MPNAALKLWAIAVCAMLALIYGGVALMLWAVSGISHWLLWALPLTPVAVIGLIVLWPLMARDQLGVTASVKQQVERDLALFRDIC